MSNENKDVYNKKKDQKESTMHVDTNMNEMIKVFNGNKNTASGEDKVMLC